MKTLLLLRHGKSDWDVGAGSDHERPLAGRGRKAAARVGRYLTLVGQVPDRVLSSTATRAHDTALRAMDAGAWPCELETTSRLYEASPRQVVQTIRSEPESTDSLLLVGHEPTWSQLSSELVGGARIRFPTAALLRIDLYVTRWDDVDFGAGELVWFVLPRHLKTLEGNA